MKLSLTYLVIPLMTTSLCLVTCPCRSAVPSPDTRFIDMGSYTDIFKKNDKDDGRDFLGQIRKDQKFLIVRRGKYKADLKVYINGKLIYIMPDEALDLPSETFDPGETYKGYDFYLSPDHRHLLVVRGLVHSLAVAYLYTRSGPGRMKAVLPGGLRLDDAALHYYCRHRHVDEDLLGSEARMVRFVQWDTAHHRLIFTMASASYWGGSNPHRGDISAFWYTAFDLKKRVFKIITHPRGLPAPQVA